MLKSPPSLRFLGPLSVTRDGSPVELPSSQKTRALLAYLAVTRRSHQRQRLCDLFWEVTDDPRGALRWSLSKLRVLDDPGAPRIRADRQCVVFEPAGAFVDTTEIRQAFAAGLPDLSVGRLQDLAGLFRGEFLDGLELPDFEEFQAWRVAVREEFRGFHRRLLRELVDRLETSPEQALVPARQPVRLAPTDESSRARLVKLLVRSGRREEAEEHYLLGCKQIRAVGVDRHQLQSAWRQVASHSPGGPSAAEADAGHQDIRFCIAPDGVRIAFATLGDGPPLVKAANWMSHLEYDWKCPLWRHLARELSREFRLVRYDQRGNGLSDRGVEDFSLNAGVGDLKAVVDAAGLERFPLLGISGGSRLALEFTARYPQRVTRLIFLGGAARGWKHWNAAARETRAGLQALMRQGWGRDVATFRQVFTTLFMPDATPEQTAWFNELQRVSTSPENACRITEAGGEGDVSARLGEIQVPTLVLHATGDAMVPFEEGRLLAAGIPGARFVTLESNNHLLLDDEPAFARFLWEVRNFLSSTAMTDSYGKRSATTLTLADWPVLTDRQRQQSDLPGSR